MVTQNSINNIVPNNDFTVQRTTNTITVAEVRNTSGLNSALISSVATSPGVGFYSSGQFGGANFWNFGMDPNAGTPMKISHNAGQADPSAGTVTWNMTTAGERTMPLQPSFKAHPSADILNVTGNGTTYEVIFNTSDFDQGADYNVANGRFTAPVTGNYIFNTSVGFGDVAVTHTSCTLQMAVNSGASFCNFVCNPFVILNAAGDACLCISGIVNLSAGDYVSAFLQISGGALQVDLRASSSFFSGALLC